MGGDYADPRPLIVHIVHRFDFGGLENGIVNLINRLPREAYRHTVLSMTTAGAFAERLQPEDAQVIALNKRPGKDFASYFRLWKQLRQLRPMVVHSRNIGTIDTQCVAALAGVPVRIHGEHGWDVSDPAGGNSKYKLLRRLLAPWIHRFVTMSDDLRRWIVEDVGISSAKALRIYSGVDTERFTPALSARAVGRPVVVGTVGRLDGIKNQQLLLQAVGVLAKRGSPQIKLLIVGDGPLRVELTKTAAELGLDADFSGLRDDVDRLLARMDVFTLPSLNEGISNTLLEAMASGLPVVATGVGGNLELVQNGVTGRLVPSGDVDALADALAEYVESATLRRQHGLAGRQFVEEGFSMDSMLSGYRQLYDGLLSANAGYK